MTFSFRPAAEFNERHGLFVALVGGTNSGKTFSALRLARGIAGPTGKIAVLDTEGGRTLHLKNEFSFDVSVMDPPHRPERYLEATRAAQDARYDCLLIDSFSMEWRGVGGVLDWMDGELAAAVERARARAEEKNWAFDEFRARQTHKMAASIRPKMAHKLMVAGFLGIRMPIIFAIRGEMTLDPDTKKEKFKAQCSPTFPFEVTVSFRLAQEKRGIIDMGDPTSFKMEKVHREFFRDGEQLAEKHGEALEAWARGSATPAAAAEAPQSAKEPLPPLYRWINMRGEEAEFGSAAELVARIVPGLARATAEQAAQAHDRNRAILRALADAGHHSEALEITRALEERARAGEGADA